MPEIYVDPILKKYRELIEAAAPGTFRGFYYGDPLVIPNSSMPALVLSKSRTVVGKLTNVEDQHDVAITLTVVTDLREQVSDDKQMVPGVAKLYEIMEKRNADYSLATGCVLDTLRKNVLVDSANNLRTDISSLTSVDYGLTVGKRAADAYAIEGNVQFIANFIQIR